MSSILRVGGARKLIQSISQFALKPGEEEAKKKGWWRFWKEGIRIRNAVL